MNPPFEATPFQYSHDVAFSMIFMVFIPRELCRAFSIPETTEQKQNTKIGFQLHLSCLALWVVDSLSFQLELILSIIVSSFSCSVNNLCSAQNYSQIFNKKGKSKNAKMLNDDKNTV